MANLGLLHNSLQVAIHALPGRDVPFLAGAVTPQQVSSHRPSYINAILIQRASTSQNPACLQCQRRGMRPFLECRRTPGHFGGCCGNCKWRDHGSQCTIRDAKQRDVESSSDDDSDPGQGQPNPGQSQGQRDGPVGDVVRIEIRIPVYDPRADPAVVN
jgi:hypothetical protein